MIPSRSNLDILFVREPFSYGVSEFAWRFAILRQGIFGNDGAFKTFVAEVIRKAGIAKLLEMLFRLLPISNSRFFPLRFYEFDRIQVHIRDKIRQIAVAIGMLRLESSLEERASPLVSGIKVAGISIPEFLHEFTDTIIFFFSHDKMKMIRHETVSPYFYERVSAIDISACEHLLQGPTLKLQMDRISAVAQIEKGKKTFIIRNGREYFSLLGPAIIQMVEFARSKYDASRHEMIISTRERFSRSNLEYQGWTLNRDNRALSAAEVKQLYLLGGVKVK